MGMKGAITVLMKECEFLGLEFGELLKFIKTKPQAFPNKTVEAYNVYKKEWD